MNEPSSSRGSPKRSIWLGIVVGWLSQLGLKVLLPVVVLTVIRFWSLQTDNKSLWLENPEDSSHPVWFVLQSSVFVGSVVAGVLAALLARRRSFAVPAALIVLSLLATAFEQFPRPLSKSVALVWAGGPCLGLLVGWLLASRLRRSDG